jgi:hypothetical protein
MAPRKVPDFGNFPVVCEPIQKLLTVNKDVADRYDWIEWRKSEVIFCFKTTRNFQLFVLVMISGRVYHALAPEAAPDGLPISGWLNDFPKDRKREYLGSRKYRPFLYYYQKTIVQDPDALAERQKELSLKSLAKKQVSSCREFN